ncbi:MAG: HDOD domain-containing protein [Pseudomonadales bacterium]|nr:HDOD domain-containing protein [Pseudomonadales bacterium]
MPQVELYRLTTLPQILLELQLELSKPDRSYVSISDIIQKDPALFVRVFATSAEHSLDSEAINWSLSTLCERLGYDVLQSIAFSSSSYQAFQNHQDGQISYIEHQWARAILGAEIARSIARISSYKHPDEAYFCALVRNIGQLVMEVQSNGLISGQIVADGSDQNIMAYEVEQFGINHILLSAQLMQGWGVSANFSDAIRYQSKSVDAIRDAHHLVKLINLAALATGSITNDDQQFSEGATRLFAIDASTSHAILTKSKEAVADQNSKYGIRWSGVDAALVSGSKNKTIQSIGPSHENTRHFREQHHQLRKLVNNISLVSSVCRFDSPAQTESELLSIAKNALKSLLNIDSSLFLLYQRYSDTVRVADHEIAPDFIREINLPVEQGRSMLSDSLLDNSPAYFFPDDDNTPDDLTVVDQQLLNFLGTSGFYSYPLSLEQGNIGILLIGVDQWHREAVTENTQLIEILTSQLRGMFESYYWQLKEHQYVADNQLKVYEMSVRKAIHEAGNPLSVIQSYLEVLGHKMDENSSARDNLSIIKSEITRVCEILDQLGRQKLANKPAFSPVDINQLVADQVKIFDATGNSSSQIEMKLDLDGRMPLVWCSASALKQILTNLILNSKEAMPAGGLISISTADQFYLNEKSYVEISIGDTGGGIDSAVMSRLYEVKRSIKGKKHSGVGLNIVQNLISEMDGLITCRSNPGGVTWQILLPRKLES